MDWPNKWHGITCVCQKWHGVCRVCRIGTLVGDGELLGSLLYHQYDL